MISQLTSEQQAKVKEYYNKYYQYGISTIPSNKPIAERAIKQMYKLMKEKEPKIFGLAAPQRL